MKISCASTGLLCVLVASPFTAAGAPRGVRQHLAIDLDERSYGAIDLRQDRGEDTWAAFQAGTAIFASEPLANRRGLVVGSELAVPTPSGVLPLPVAGRKGRLMMLRPWVAVRSWNRSTVSGNWSLSNLKY